MDNESAAAGEKTEDFVFQKVLDDLCQELIDDVTLGVCFEIHRAARRGYLFIGHPDKNDKPRAVVDRPGVDVFGQSSTKKQVDCVCPNCSRNMAAQRFAPHLEKCMGMGRNSSRIASRRIANNHLHPSSKRDSEESDDGNDSDWSSNADRRVKKIKKEKLSNSPRRVKTKLRNGDGENLSLTPETQPSYDTMTLDEKKSLLLSTCGVISDHTHKMCTKSVKCPLHTDEQRRAVRIQLIGQISGSEGQDIQVDIDTYDDGDGQSMRETLQWDVVSNPSPTDSSSNNNNSLSKKRPPKSKSLPLTSKRPKPGYHSKQTLSQPSNSDFV